MKKIILFSTLILLSSCKFGIDYEVENNTINNIDSLTISNGFNSSSLYNINSKERQKGFLDFKKNNPNHDGLHHIKIFIKDSTLRKSFGYYSNGIPSVESYKIIINFDSIIIKGNYHNGFYQSIQKK